MRSLQTNKQTKTLLHNKMRLKVWCIFISIVPSLKIPVQYLHWWHQTYLKSPLSIFYLQIYLFVFISRCKACIILRLAVGIFQRRSGNWTVITRVYSIVYLICWLKTYWIWLVYSKLAATPPRSLWRYWEKLHLSFSLWVIKRKSIKKIFLGVFTLY